MAKRQRAQLFLLVLAAAFKRSAVSGMGVYEDCVSRCRNDWMFNNSNGPSPRCTNPNGQIGACLNIKQCPSLLNMLQQQRHVPGVIDFLRASVCGYEGRDPKVCCPGLETSPTVAPPDSSSSASVRKPVWPEMSECGTSFYEPLIAATVVGGYPVALGKWPWIVALGYKSSPAAANQFLCGGALITRRHVITAAHCVHRRRDLYIARVGELDLDANDDGAAPIDFLIQDRKVHEGYNSRPVSNDIALLKLQDDVTFTNLIQPICLPLPPDIRSQDFVGTSPFVAGWGSVYFTGPTSSHLMELQIPVVTETQCKEAFKTYTTAQINDRVLCAGLAEGGKDSCQGDSGGPLMWSKDKRYYLIGIVSYGYRCAEPGYPGIYTRVTAFLDWITSNIT